MFVVFLISHRETCTNQQKMTCVDRSCMPAYQKPQNTIVYDTWYVCFTIVPPRIVITGSDSTCRCFGSLEEMQCSNLQSWFQLNPWKLKKLKKLGSNKLHPDEIEPWKISNFWWPAKSWPLKSAMWAEELTRRVQQMCHLGLSLLWVKSKTVEL